MLWLKCYVASVTITTSNNVDGKRLKFKNFGGQFFFRFFSILSKAACYKTKFYFKFKAGRKIFNRKSLF